MSDMKRVNPEVVEVSAKMARLGGFAVGGSWSINKQGEVWDAARKTRFDVLLSLSDAWLLEEALNKAGWIIRFVDSPSYEKWFAKNEKPFGSIVPQSDDDRRLILYKCVAAMTSLPLYAEESMG